MRDLFLNVETGRMFKKVREGTGRQSGLFLWQPMKKVLFFFVPDYSRRPFWLDEYGFERVQRGAENGQA